MSDSYQHVWRPFNWFILRGAGMPFDWLEGLGDTPVWLLDEDAYQTRLERSRTRLWEFTREASFREAVFMSSPQVYGLLDRWREGFDPDIRKNKDRKRERTLYRFLTRFTAKNDTTSFFGATSIGDLKAERSGPISLPVADTRRVFLEHWVAESLLQRIQAELDAACGWQGASPELPVGHPRVLKYLRGILNSQPDGQARRTWLERLASLESRLNEFAEAHLERREVLFAALETDLGAWLDAETRRGDGQYYSSKTIIHEVGDRSGEVIGLNRAEKDALSAVAPVMELCALQVLVDRLKAEAFLKQKFGDASVPFATMMEALTTAGTDYHLNAPAEARELYSALGSLRLHLRERIDAALERDASPAEVELMDERVQSFLEEWKGALDRTGTAYTNPDLLLASTPEGPPRVVIGDMHSMPFLTPAAFAAAPNEEEVWAETRAFLAELCGPETPAFLTHKRASFVAYVPDLGEVALEIDARASVPEGRRATLESLMVRWTPSGFRFQAETPSGESVDVMPLTRAANLMSRYSETIQKMARVYPLRLFDVGKWLSGPGWKTPGELPRLALNGVIVHRRLWELPSDAWIGSECAEAFRKLRQLAGEHLPRFCYVKGAHQPKPLLVDFADPVSAELLLWMARNEGQLTLSEMLPGPGELWLGGPEGRYTSELRTVFTR